MTFFSRRTDYALLILHALAQNGSGMSAREAANLYGIGRPFIANILKLLCLGGLVRSQRGASGGYTLARPAGSITLDQVFQACEEPFQLTECTSEDAHGCSVVGICPLKQGMALLHNRMLALLRDVSLAELFGSGSVQLLNLGLARIPVTSNPINQLEGF
jgi:Rrf2 family protein